MTKDLYPKSSRGDVARRNYVINSGLKTTGMICIGEWWVVTARGDLFFFGAGRVVFHIKADDMVGRTSESVREMLEDKVWFSESGPYDTSAVRADFENAYMCVQGHLLARRKW